MEILYIALDESADAAMAVADNPDEINVHMEIKTIFETNVQLPMVNVCRETEKE